MQMNGRSAYVPYRESKLTSLLKESIGGNSYSLMISGLSSSDKFVEENVSTLNYSAKANCISNTPIKNQDPNIKIIAQLKVLLLRF
jgi:kinesin family protein 4/21/27